MTDLRPTPADRFTFGLWTVGWQWVHSECEEAPAWSGSGARVVTGEPTPAVRARYAAARDKIVDQELVNNV